MEELYFHKIIGDLCEKKNIKMEKLSFDWILKLSKKDQVKHIIRYAIEWNSHVSCILAKDKYATFTMLTNNKIPVIQYHIFFNPKTRAEYANPKMWNEVKKLYETYQKKLVIKSNEGTQGIQVYLSKSFRKTKKIMKKLFKTEDAVCVCPFYDFEVEYRAVYIAGEVLTVIGKRKPFVIGDGKSKVKELIQKQGVCLWDNKATQIAKKEIDFSYVPKKDEKYNIYWKNNLSSGAIAFVLEDEALKKRIEEIAKQAAHAINIKSATIDVIHMSSDELKVMEINSSIGITKFAQTVEHGEEIAYRVYERLLDKMFEDN